MCVVAPPADGVIVAAEIGVPRDGDLFPLLLLLTLQVVVVAVEDGTGDEQGVGVLLRGDDLPWDELITLELPLRFACC